MKNCFDRNLGAASEVDNALHDLLEAKAQLVEFEGAMREAVAALSVIEADILKTKKMFVSETHKNSPRPSRKLLVFFRILPRPT